LESFNHAVKSGCDILSTTLSGYTKSSATQNGPDLDLVRKGANKFSHPILAEGRYAEPWQVKAALLAGASGVVIGGAINDPIKQTRKFVQTLRRESTPIAAIDLGGTWLRFAVVSPNGDIIHSERIPNPKRHAQRIDFILSACQHHRIKTVGIAAGGTINPTSKLVSEAKDMIPDYQGQTLDLKGLKTYVINDGLATAWGHACHRRFSGLNVATLALGTGVGAGIASLQKLQTNEFGHYPRLNDLPFQNGILEDALGGLALTQSPSTSDQKRAAEATDFAIKVLSTSSPDIIVVCGGVGLSPWLQNWLSNQEFPIQVVASPYGENAGIMGAAHLALNPPADVFGAYS
jgi:predicted NBD/HSP70 family sugar kinase